jgi:sulfite reductase alpha subunit-like flavoprotein
MTPAMYAESGKPLGIIMQEWSTLQAKGVLVPGNGLVCAFSRDQASKVYVQHKILEHGEVVWEMLHSQTASFFVSGSASKMPASVADAVVGVISKALPCDQKEARVLQRRLELAQRYTVEAWS